MLLPGTGSPLAAVAAPFDPGYADIAALRSALDDLGNAPRDAERLAAVGDRMAVFEKSLRGLRAPNPHLW